MKANQFLTWKAISCLLRFSGPCPDEPCAQVKMLGRSDASGSRLRLCQHQQGARLIRGPGAACVSAEICQQAASQPSKTERIGAARNISPPPAIHKGQGIRFPWALWGATYK
jgi:hypothetical protein